MFHMTMSWFPESVLQQRDNVLRLDRSNENLVGLRKKCRHRFPQCWIVTHDDGDRVRMKVPHCVYQCESVAGCRNVKITNQRGELFGGEKNYSLLNGGRCNYFEAACLEGTV